MAINVKNEPNNMKDPRPTPPTDSMAVKHLGNTVDKVSLTPDAVSKMIADAVAEALKVAIPAAAVGIATAQGQAAEKSRETIIRETMRRTKRCPVCALPETACGGAFEKDKDGKDIIELNADGSQKQKPELNHIKAYVGPSDANLFRWFQGFTISGVRFLSDFPGHKIWIPKKSDILTNVNYWEQDQKDLLQKRTAEGMGAGSIGPGGAQPGSQKFIGWR
jgi:hypothetical protein